MKSLVQVMMLAGLAGSLILSTTTASAQFANPAIAQGCHFLCQRVPAPTEIQKTIGAPTTDALPLKTLNILSWNIYKGRKPSFFPVYRQLATGADVILMSEATDGDLVRPALEGTPGFGWQMAINFFMKDNVATGIVAGTRARPSGVVAKQTPDLEPWVKSPKTILLTKYPVRGPDGRLAGEILFVNIHGINWAGNDAFVRHLALAEPYMRSHKGPILFAGDFNTKNAERRAILANFAQQFGMQRLPWKNAPPEGEKTLDDAYARGFQVVSAEYLFDVIGGGSDHPALAMQLTPDFRAFVRDEEPRNNASQIK